MTQPYQFPAAQGVSGPPPDDSVIVALWRDRGGQTILGKMLQVRERVCHLGTNKNGPNGAYTDVKKIMSEVARVCNELGITTTTYTELLETKLIPKETNSGNRITLRSTTLRVTIVFTDTETGEYELASGIGSGEDNGPAGSRAATSYAQKNALISAFLITPDDASAGDGRGSGGGRAPERREQRPQGRPEQPRREQSGREVALTEIKRALAGLQTREFLAEFGISRVDDLPEDRFDRAKRWCADKRHAAERRAS